MSQFATKPCGTDWSAWALSSRAHGLESETARQFLEQMPKLDVLMPQLQMAEVEQLIAVKREQRRAIGWVN